MKLYLRLKYIILIRSKAWGRTN